MIHSSIILFDGVCILCNSSVQYIIRHDPKAVFSFATLQSDTGQLLLQKFNLPQQHLNSIILIQDDIAYQKSTAVLKIARQLSGAVKIFYGFIIVPAFIRDAVYTFIARNRYKWFGQKNECMIPGPALQKRFLK